MAKSSVSSSPHRLVFLFTVTVFFIVGRNMNIQRPSHPGQSLSWLAAFLFCSGSILFPVTSHGQSQNGTIFVSPEGRGSDCSHLYPCSLEAARDRAREIASEADHDLTIELAPGRYRMTAPLVLGQKDSGRDGHPIHWQGSDLGRTVLDGGVQIRGWMQVDSQRNLWRAKLPQGAYSLQLFINGVRAERARHPGCSSPAQCKYDANGLTGAGRMLSGLSHPEDVVAVFNVRWRDFHCGVEKIHGDDLIMREPCWQNTIADSIKNHWSNASPKGKPFKGIEWFENAYEFLGTPGQFYIDPRRHLIYYVPRPGENMKTADVEMPVTEHLLLVEGSSSEHLHDIEFKNIYFQHSAWTYAEHSEGYVPLQAGYLVTGTRTDLPDNGEGLQRIPAAVEVSGGEHIRFVFDHFSALGSAGIALSMGTRESIVERCSFDDLSGGAVFVGDIVAAPQNPKQRSGGVVVSRNTITDVAKEYRDNVAIMGGFNDGLTIDHNTIRELPYTGISVGWGWNYEGERDSQRDIHIHSNLISRFMLILHDGGAIYTQAQSPGSDVIENYIDYRGSGDGNGIYLDERSRKYEVCGNVVWDVPKKMQEGQWLSTWSSWSGDLKIHDNWSDDSHTKLHNPGPTKEFYNNHLALDALLPEAQSVVNASGVGGGDALVAHCIDRSTKR
jgi:hypothetical protein